MIHETISGLLKAVEAAHVVPITYAEVTHAVKRLPALVVTARRLRAVQTDEDYEILSAECVLDLVLLTPLKPPPATSTLSGSAYASDRLVALLGVLQARRFTVEEVVQWQDTAGEVGKQTEVFVARVRAVTAVTP